MNNLYQFRPQRSSSESLEAIFVARENLLEKILGHLVQWQPGGSRQHYLLIGPRGIGKTHVLRLVSHGVSLRAELNKKWQPIVFAEESYAITRISDLLLEALRILYEESGDETVGCAWRELRYDDDDERVTDLSLDAFRKFNRTSGKGLIFMVENINRLFERQIKNKSQIHLLRKILIEEEWIVSLCTSPTYLGAVTKEEEPLFEFFQVEFLPELSSDEQREMLEKLADYENNENFKEYLKKYHSRLKALYHFTGGNPRLTMMLYDLISRHAITDVQAELDGLLDKITPFYQDRMKDIGEQEGKIIETMARMPEGCNPAELARESRMQAKTIRAVLQRLLKAGYVKREERRQKKTVYIIPGRLFRIWHQMNHSRAGRGMVHDLLEFFTSWYESREERDAVREKIQKKIPNRTYDEAEKFLGGPATVLDKSGSESPIFFLEKIIEDIVQSSGDESPGIMSAVLRKFLKVAFRSSDLKRIEEVIESIRAHSKLNNNFFYPYTIALEYLESDRDPGVIERQQPEMRDAVELLVAIYDEGTH